jgi:hypothetical protein
MRTPLAHIRFAELESAFERAIRTHGEITFPMALAGRRVDLCFAGPALVGLLTPALAHLRASGGDAEHIIRIGDIESTGVTPRLAFAETGTGAAAGDRESPTTPPGAYLAMTPDMLWGLEPDGRRGFFWVRSAGVLKPWDVAAPLRLLLSWLAEVLGAQLVHGAVVGHGHDGVLLAGKGGSGKSTTTLSCIESGLTTVGDDYVWMEPGDPPMAFSLFGTVKIDPEALRTRFVRLAPYARDLTGMLSEKMALFLAEAPGVRWTRALNVRAVAALRIGQGTTPRVGPASLVEVLMALAPSSLLQSPVVGSSGLARLTNVVRRCHALRCEVGSDYARNARAIGDLVDPARLAS